MTPISVGEQTLVNLDVIETEDAISYLRAFGTLVALTPDGRRGFVRMDFPKAFEYFAEVEIDWAGEVSVPDNMGQRISPFEA